MSLFRMSLQTRTPRIKLPVFRVGSIDAVGTYPSKKTNRNRIKITSVTVIGSKDNFTAFFIFFISTIKNRDIEMLFLDVPYYIAYIPSRASISGRFFKKFLALDTQAQTRLADTPNSFPISLLERPLAI